MIRDKESNSDSPLMRYLKERYVGNDPAAIAEYEQMGIDIDVAQAVYDLRTEAKFSPRRLAAKVGTAASVIEQLEAADYPGNSLAMLARIAAALGKRIEIRVVPATKSKRKPRKAA